MVLSLRKDSYRASNMGLQSLPRIRQSVYSSPSQQPLSCSVGARSDDHTIRSFSTANLIPPYGVVNSLLLEPPTKIHPVRLVCFPVHPLQVVIVMIWISSIIVVVVSTQLPYTILTIAMRLPLERSADASQRNGGKSVHGTHFKYSKERLRR